MSHTYQTCEKCGERKRLDYFHKYPAKNGPKHRTTCKKCGSDGNMEQNVAKENRKLQKLINWPDLCKREQTYG